MSCASTSAHFTSLKLRTLLPTPAIHSRFEEIPPFQRDSTSNYLARPIPADFRIRTTRILREISRGRRRWKPGFFQTKRRVARISTRIFAREKPITNGILAFFDPDFVRAVRVRVSLKSVYARYAPFSRFFALLIPRLLDNHASSFRSGGKLKVVQPRCFEE